MRAAHSVINPASYAQRAVSRYQLDNDLRMWYLRMCQERVDSDGQRYFERRREARRWFRALCDNRHFHKVLADFRREKEPLSQAISLVSWLKDAQQTVNNQFIPYKGVGRLSTLDKLDAKGGLQVLLSPKLDDRLPNGARKRPTTIAGLLDFLGLPSTHQEVASALRRYAQASVIPAKPKSAVEITRLLYSWGAPNTDA